MSFAGKDLIKTTIPTQNTDPSHSSLGVFPGRDQEQTLNQTYWTQKSAGLPPFKLPKYTQHENEWQSNTVTWWHV